MVLVIEVYNVDLYPSFTKFNSTQSAMKYLEETGYDTFKKHHDHIRAEMDYNTAFIYDLDFGKGGIE